MIAYIRYLPLLVMVALFLNLNVLLAQIETPTSETSIELYSDILPFPYSLYCDEIDEPYGGPSWGEIEIGRTTESELIEYIKNLSNIYLIGQYSSRVNFEIPFDVDEPYLPPNGQACLSKSTDTIVALRIFLNSQSSKLMINDLVAQYGIPDSVTYSYSSGDRLVFWFEKGLAAEINVDHSYNAPAFGYVRKLVYFPYMTPDEYEEKWPYNRTQPILLPLHEIVNPPLPTERNPFDFEAMIATITAEPSRTPTPTFTPRASDTLMLTPNATTRP